MLVVFLGPPGSGKGTQAKIISSRYSFKHVSTGDMLREVSKSGTKLGNILSKVMARGELVTDDLVNQIVSESLSKPEYRENCILDGYPRTLAQGQFLDRIISSEYIVINFVIDLDKLKERISKRFVCIDCGSIYNEISSPTKILGICDKCGSTKFEHRADDNEHSLINRVDAYNKQNSSLVEYYLSNNRLFSVNADDDVDNVTKTILNKIKNN